MAIGWNVFSDTKQANQYRDQAETFLKNNDIAQAVSFAEKAIQADPGNGYFDYYTAYIYLYKTEDRGKALDLLKAAEKKGYVNGLLYHRMGMCYFHLKNFQSAVAYLYQSIDFNKIELTKAEENKNSSGISSLKKEIADSYVWLTKQYEALDEPSQFIEAVREGLTYNPKDRWLPGLSKKMMLPAGHQAFAEKKYDQSLAYYREAKESGADWDWLDDIIEIVGQCKTKPVVSPVYTHRIGVIYVNETRLIPKSGQIITSPDITAIQKKKAKESQLIFQDIVELFSGGKFSVSFTDIDATLSFDEFSLIRRSNPDNLNLGEFFYTSMNTFDTFVTMSNTESPYFGEGNFGGSRRYPYINGVSYGPARGMVMVSGGSGFGTLLHEFFHTLESLAGIRPAHGFRQPGQFPDWKGTTELDYYRWHFETTLSSLGFDKLNFRNRYPAQPPDPAVFNKIQNVYKNIPLTNRQEANSLVLEAEQIQNKEAAFRLYEKVLNLSPYQPRALEFMISWFKQNNDTARTKEHQAELKEIAAVSDTYPVFDFYHFLKEVKSGIVIGTWSRDTITITGSELSWDADNFIKYPGTYNVTFLFNEGQKAATIEWAALFENGKLLFKDTHNGWSGNSKRDIVYRLKVENRIKDASYILRARIRGEGGTDSFGEVLLRRVDE